MYSQDIDVTKIVLVLEDVNGEKIDLTDSDVRVALQFANTIIEDVGEIESLEEQSISYSPGDRFKYQEGLVAMAFYVTLKTKQCIDISHFKINFKRSLIDSDRVAESLEAKFVSFDSIIDGIMNEIVEKKKTFDSVLDENSIVKSISQKIEKLQASLDKLSSNNDDIYSRMTKLEQRRAPTGYTLDRTTVPWTIWFDNGCGLQFPEFPDSDIVYGCGMDNGMYPAISTNPPAYPLIYKVISASVGNYTPRIFGFESDMSFHFWRESATVLNPIRDSTIYDWTNCCGDGECRRKDTKSVVPRVLYELGIWSDSDVKLLGATLK